MSMMWTWPKWSARLWSGVFLDLFNIMCRMIVNTLNQIFCFVTILGQVACYAAGFPCKPYSLLNNHSKMLYDRNAQQLYQIIRNLKVCKPAVSRFWHSTSFNMLPLRKLSLWVSVIRNGSKFGLLENVLGFKRVMGRVLGVLRQNLPQKLGFKHLWFRVLHGVHFFLLFLYMPVSQVHDIPHRPRSVPWKKISRPLLVFSFFGGNVLRQSFGSPTCRNRVFILLVKTDLCMVSDLGAHAENMVQLLRHEPSIKWNLELNFCTSDLESCKC